jgi:hypothetical protein
MFVAFACEAMERFQAFLSRWIAAADCQAYRNWAINGFYWWPEIYHSLGFQALLLKLFPERVKTSLAMFEEIGLQEVPGGSIVSIGCGFAAELVAAYGYLEERLQGVPRMRFIGIDPVPSWQLCFNQLNNSCFEFWIGELRNNAVCMWMLCGFLRWKRATHVIFSHVVFDYAAYYIEDVISCLFEIETVQRVIIMERKVNFSPDAPQGCRKFETTIQRTKVIVYERATWDVNGIDALSGMFNGFRIEN